MNIENMYNSRTVWNVNDDNVYKKKKKKKS